MNIPIPTPIQVQPALTPAVQPALTPTPIPLQASTPEIVEQEQDRLPIYFGELAIVKVDLSKHNRPSVKEYIKGSNKRLMDGDSIILDKEEATNLIRGKSYLTLTDFNVSGIEVRP